MINTGDGTSTKPAARRLEVFTGAGQRRRWSEADKAAIVAESYANMGTVSEVARRHGLASSQLFAWRRDARLAAEASAGGALPRPSAFVPVLIEAPSIKATPAAPPARTKAKRRRGAPAVEIEIDGARVRIAPGTTPGMIAAVIDALKAPR